jgi:guanylate kinase
VRLPEDLKGAILLLSGPSGSGKSSLCKELFKNIGEYYFSISTTTRAKRDGEVDGVHYFYVTKEQFEQDIDNRNFLEWAEVHGNYYGTSIKPVIKALQEDKIVVFDVDVQGFEIIRKKIGHLCTSVFITTPTLSDLKSRLIGRGTDSQETIEKRLFNAKEEMQYINEYDYLVVNDDFDTALNKLENIVKVCRDRGSMVDLDNFISNWNK